MSMRRSGWLLGLATIAVACATEPNDEWGHEDDFEAPSPSEEKPGTSTKTEKAPLTAEQVRLYLSQLAPYLVGRELSDTENTAISRDRIDAVASVLEGWALEPGFARSMRRIVEERLSVSGSSDGINFALPGNLAEHVAKNDLPVSTLLTADYCVSNEGEEAECDTGAPYNAGLLTTRAFMKGRAGRFNLTRATYMMSFFACRSYPMDIEPHLPRDVLIQMFQVDSVDEIEDERAAGEGFGNGSACYGCHGQFGAHAQFFVRFDNNGLYQAEATGQQDPDGELGRSFNGLYTSHFHDPEASGLERGQMLGQSAENLREAAERLAQAEVFVPCQVRSVFGYALGRDLAAPLPDPLVEELAQLAKRKGDPTFANLVVSIFSHPTIINSVAEGFEAP